MNEVMNSGFYNLPALEAMEPASLCPINNDETLKSFQSLIDRMENLDLVNRQEPSVTFNCEFGRPQ